MLYKRPIVFHLVLSGLSFFVLICICMGCRGGLKQTKPVPAKPVAGKIVFPKLSKENQSGSLWHESGPLSELFINPIARRVGDIVTIKIAEKSAATNEANTDTARKSSLSAGVTNMFGLQDRYKSAATKPQPFFNPFGKAAGSFQSSFSGSGATNRSGTLTADITARVTEVTANGNLKIIGTREVTVNDEKQLITLSGTIRPRDISTDNTIESSRIADAQITYSGAGVIDRRQRQGWFVRIFDALWPF